MKSISLGFLLCGVLAIESCAVGYLYRQATKSAHHRYLFLQRYALRTLLAPFFSAPDILRETQESYIGELDKDRRWRIFLPADSLLGWRLGRNITASQSGRYFYVTNAQGFASIGKVDFSYQKTKPPNTCRVIVVGGSTVFGAGALAPGENLPAQLSELFQRQQLCPNTEVINAGVPSYTSSQELLYVMSELVNYNPDLIIEYGGWNDMEINNQSINERGDGSDFRTIVHASLERRLNDSYTVPGSLRHLLGSIRGDIVLKAYALYSGNFFG